MAGVGQWWEIPWQSSCLRLSTSTAGGMGSNPGQETKIPHCHAVEPPPKKTKWENHSRGLEISLSVCLRRHEINVFSNTANKIMTVSM